MAVFTGVENTERITASEIQNIVSNTIWKVKKFITNDEELEYGGVISKAVLSRMGITEEKMGGEDAVRRWWTDHKKTVKNGLLRKRNNTGRKIREKMEGKRRRVGMVVDVKGDVNLHTTCTMFRSFCQQKS